MELFWTLTPREFHFCYEAFQNNKEDSYRSQWEQTRMIVYYQYCSYPKKGQNPSYHKFKAQHLPFPWDLINKNIEDEDLMVEDAQGLTPSDWLERISKLTVDKTLEANEVNSIK